MLLPDSDLHNLHSSHGGELQVLIAIRGSALYILTSARVVFNPCLRGKD